MTSKYSIVQYVPNPIADERINIGVVAFNDEQVRVQFLENWERVRHFGMGDIDFLKDFASRMSESASTGKIFPGDKRDGTPNHERLTKIALGWINSIQFTEPRGSLDTVDNLLEDIAATYLIESNFRKPKLRDRQTAARIATSQIRKVLEQRVKGEAKELLKTNYRLPGRYAEHKFDAVVTNGQPYLAAQGISFEVHTKEHLQNSLSWMITDVKECLPALPIAIVVLPPIKDVSNYQQLQTIYQQATSIYSEIGADVIQENQVENWASERLKEKLPS